MPAGTVIVDCMYPDISPAIMVTFDLDGFIIVNGNLDGLTSEGPLIAVEGESCFIFGQEPCDVTAKKDVSTETMELNPTYITVSA